MTPQESQLVGELFDRLAKLETTPRDPDAERAITDGAQRAPHSIYALVQTALVQDEALKRANTRIEELQAQLSDTGEPAQQQQPSFLDSMREAAFGKRDPRGSVPSVRAAAPGDYSQSQSPPGNLPQAAAPPYPAAPAFGGGGSFLGTAASTAAGFIGGALLLDGIRSMMGSHLGGYTPSAMGNFAGEHTSPWGGGSAADSQLARDAGINHIGEHVHGAENDQPAAASDSSVSADDEEEEVADADDLGGDDFDSGGDNFDS